MDALLYALLGFFFGVLSRFVYDWNLDQKERKTIKESLLLEILYMHEPTMRLQLDQYRQSYQEKFKREDLLASLWRPTYPTRIYESYMGKIDRLIGSDICLQLHYYYSLIDSINKKAAEPDANVTEEFAHSFLESIARTYVMGIGAVSALLGKAEARKAMRENLRSLVYEFEDIPRRQYVAEILVAYRQRGAADALIRMTPMRRLKNLLRRNRSGDV